MATKFPLNPASEETRYISVVVDHFSNYIVTVRIPGKNAR